MTEEYNFVALPQAILNKHYKTVKEQTELWVEQMGLLKTSKAKAKILIADFSRLTSLAYPIASLDHLRLINDWMYWIFFYDDVLEISEAVVAEQMKSNLFAIMDNKPWVRSSNDYLNKIHQAWEDINRRWQVWTNAKVQQRWVDSHKGYVEAAFTLANYRRNNECPDSKTLRDLREKDIGMYPSYVLMEITLSNINEEVIQDERIIRMSQLAARNVYRKNDIFSLSKDKRDGEQINEVFVRQKEDNLTEEEAIEYINQCLIRELSEFEQAYQEIENEPAKKAYADGLRHWIVGHEEWGKHSLRYQGNKQKEVQENIESVEQIALIQIEN